jgi:hypothetical protein
MLSPVSEIPRDETEPPTPASSIQANSEQVKPSEADLGVRRSFVHFTPLKERTTKVTEQKLPTTSYSVKARKKSFRGFSSVVRRNVIGSLTTR